MNKESVERDPYRILSKIKALEVLMEAGWTFEGALETLEMTKEDYEKWMKQLKERGII